jgi:hypothetical protein
MEYNIREEIERIFANNFKDIDCFWQFKIDVNDIESDQYIIYKTDGMIEDNFADNNAIVNKTNVVILYYYNNILLKNYDTKQKVKDNFAKITKVMKENDYSVILNGFDLGNIDRAEYLCTGFEFLKEVIT